MPCNKYLHRPFIYSPLDHFYLHTFYTAYILYAHISSHMHVTAYYRFITHISHTIPQTVLFTHQHVHIFYLILLPPAAHSTHFLFYYIHLWYIANTVFMGNRDIRISHFDPLYFPLPLSRFPPPLAIST